MSGHVLRPWATENKNWGYGLKQRSTAQHRLPKRFTFHMKKSIPYSKINVFICIVNVIDAGVMDGLEDES